MPSPFEDAMNRVEQQPNRPEPTLPDVVKEPTAYTPPTAQSPDLSLERAASGFGDWAQGIARWRTPEEQAREYTPYEHGRNIYSLEGAAKGLMDAWDSAWNETTNQHVSAGIRDLPVLGGVSRVGELAFNLLNKPYEAVGEPLAGYAGAAVQQAFEKGAQAIGLGDNVDYWDARTKRAAQLVGVDEPKTLDDYAEIGKAMSRETPQFTQFAAGLVLDPLNFIPGAGIGAKQIKKAESLLDPLEGALKTIDELAPGIATAREAERGANIVEKAKNLFKPDMASAIKATLRDASENLIANLNGIDNVQDQAKYLDTLARAAREPEAYETLKRVFGEGVTAKGGQVAARLAGGLEKVASAVLRESELAKQAIVGAPQQGRMAGAFKEALDTIARKGLLGADAARVIDQAATAEMATRAAKTFVKNGERVWGKLPEPSFARRWLENIRSVEGLIYIGLSPATIMRNFINNKFTLALEGVNPFLSTERRIAALARVNPEKANALRQIQRQGQQLFAMRDAVNKGLGDLANSAFGSKQTGLLKKIPSLNNWYAKIEQADRMLAWETGAMKFLSSNWVYGRVLPKMDSATELMLDAISPDLRRTITAIAESTGLDHKTRAMLISEALNGRGATVNMEGITRKLSAVMSQEMGRAIELTEDQARALIGANGNEVIREVIEEIAARMSAGQPFDMAKNGALDDLARINARHIETSKARMYAAKPTTARDFSQADDAAIAKRLQRLENRVNNEGRWTDAMHEEYRALQNEKAARAGRATTPRPPEEPPTPTAPASPTEPPTPPRKPYPGKPDFEIKKRYEKPDFRIEKKAEEVVARKPYVKPDIERAGQVYTPEFLARKKRAEMAGRELRPKEIDLSLRGEEPGIAGRAYTEEELARFTEEAAPIVEPKRIADVYATAYDRIKAAGYQPIDIVPNYLVNILNKQIRDNALTIAPFTRADLAKRVDDAVGVLEKWTPSGNDVKRLKPLEGVTPTVKPPEPKAKKPKAVEPPAAEPKPVEPVAAPAPKPQEAVGIAERNRGGKYRVTPLDKATPEQRAAILKNKDAVEELVAAEQAKGKVGKSGGFTPTQEKYIVEELKKIRDGLPEFVDFPDRLSGKNTLQLPESKTTIRVPGDGTIGVVDQAQADHLIDVIEKGTVRKSKEALKFASRTIEEEADRAMQMYGHPQVALDSIDRQLEWLSTQPDDITKRVDSARLTQLREELSDRARGVVRREKQSRRRFTGYEELPYNAEEEMKRLGAPQKYPEGYGQSGGEILGTPRTPFGENVLDDAQRRAALEAEFGLTERVADDASFAYINDQSLWSKAESDMTDKLIAILRDELKQLPTADLADVRGRVMQWVNKDVRQATADASRAASVHGDWMEKATVLNYDNRLGIDNLMMWATPFPFWRNHFAAETLRRAVDNPKLTALYLNMAEQLSEAQNSPDFPANLRGKIRFPVPFLPEFMGGGLFFDPLETISPVKSVFGVSSFRKSVDDNDVAQTIRSMVGGGKISRADAEYAILNQKTSTLWAQTKKALQEQQQSAPDFSGIFGVHAPLDIAWKLKTGNAQDINAMLPFTRLARGAEAMGVPFAGHIAGIEPALRKAMGLPEYEAGYWKRIDKQLASMVGEGKIDGRTALIAMMERKGAAFDEAKNRAMQEGLTTALSPVMGGAIFNQGEQKYYATKALEYQLLDAEIIKAGGDPEQMTIAQKWAYVKDKGLTSGDTRLAKFFDANPVLSARGAAFDEPEERLKNFLVDEFWTKYNGLSAARRKEFRQEYTDEQFAAFLNKETRDYAKLSLDKLSEWVYKLNGYIPPTAEVGQAKPSVTPFKSKLSDKESAAYDAYLAKQTQLGGDALFKLSDQYYALPQGSQARRDFLAANPNLKAWWDYKREFIATNPKIAALLGESPSAQPATAINQSFTPRASGGAGLGAKTPRGYTPYTPKTYSKSGYTPYQSSGYQGAAGGLWVAMNPYITRLERYWSGVGELDASTIAGLLPLWRRYKMGTGTFQEWLEVVKKLHAGTRAKRY